MTRFFLLLSALIFNVYAFAADTKEKLVSVSYVQIKQCFPLLEDAKLSFKVNMNELKEKIDSKYVTTLSRLQSRIITYAELNGERYRLTMLVQPKKIGKPVTFVKMEKFDQSGQAQPVEVPSQLEIDPRQKDLNMHLMNAKIESDISYYIDSKYHGLQMIYQKDRLKILNLELSDPAQHKTLSCDERETLGVVCTCKM